MNRGQKGTGLVVRFSRQTGFVTGFAVTGFAEIVEHGARTCQLLPLGQALLLQFHP